MPRTRAHVGGGSTPSGTAVGDTWGGHGARDGRGESHTATSSSPLEPM